LPASLNPANLQKVDYFGVSLTRKCQTVLLAFGLEHNAGKHRTTCLESPSGEVRQSMCARAEPGSAPGALARLQTVADVLAGLDAAEVPAEALGQYIRGLVQADAVLAAALARMLAAYDARDGHLADGQRSLGAWLVHVARVTRGQAAQFRALRALPRDHEPLLAGLRTRALTAMVQAVLDALSAPAGGRDLRTRPQRYHDALAEATALSSILHPGRLWTTYGQGGRKSSSESMPSERDPRRGGVGTDAT
jgi:hypothetical protein